MRARLAVALPSLAAALLGACFDFDATTAGGPLDGSVETGETDAAPVGDATSDGGPVSDSATDGSALPPGDAGVDSVAPIDAGHPEGSVATGYCATIAPDAGAFFCDDFDEHQLPQGWSSYGENSGTLLETDAASVSAPNSIEAKINALGSGQTLDVSLRRQLTAPSPPSTLRFGFSLEPVQLDTTLNAAIVLGAVDFLDAQNDRFTLGLAINVLSAGPTIALGQATAYADGGAPPFMNYLLSGSPLQLSKWTNVVLQINWTSAAAAEVFVTIDGVTELHVPSLEVTVVPNIVQIGVGTAYVTEPSPVWELRFDDVWFAAR